MKKRITDLEIENGSLSNGFEANRIQLVQSSGKINLLEKQVQDLRSENNGLKIIVNQIRLDYQSFGNRVMKEIMDLKRESPPKKGPNGFMIHRNNSARHNTFESSPAAKLGKLSFFGEADLDYKRVNSERSDSFLRNDYARGSMSASFLNDFDGNDKHFGVPVIEEDSKEIMLHAVQPHAGLFKIPTASGDVEKLQASRKASNHPEVDGLNRSTDRSTGRLEIQSPSEMGTSIKKTFMESAKVFKPDRLFENFFVLGTTKEDAIDRIKSYTGKAKTGDSVSFSAKVVYDFAETAGLENRVTLPDIERFLTPWQLLMTPYNSLSNVADSTFFKVVLKSQKKYKKRYICPFQPHNGDIQLSKWTEYVESINPQNKLYAICIKKGDYIMLDSLKANKKHFIYIDTVYCLLTYYPIPELAFNFLSSILNFTRMKRKELFWSSEDKTMTDFSKLNALLPIYLSSYLKQIMGLEIPAPNRILSYPINNDKVAEYDMMEYKFPAKENAYLELAMWEAYKTFRKFSLENISFILSAILLEKSVVFFSKDITMLTSILNTFLGLLFPFKYVCTLIPAIPSNSEFLFEAPVPIIIGVNRNEHYFWKKELDVKSQCIFVFTDSQIIYVDQNYRDLIDYPKLDFITEGLQGKFAENGFDFITDPDVLEQKISKVAPPETEIIKKEKDLNTETASEDVGLTKKIFEHFRKRFMDKMVSVFVNFKDYNPSDATEEDFEKMIIAKISDAKIKEFFAAFRDTQAFNCYPYSVSLPQK